MRISNRLKAMFNQISNGESVADIGTDHGYIPILLIEKGISNKVILSDISNGSLDKAKQNFSDRSIELISSDFRLGDGLEVLKNGEVDDILIGGLGGKTITEILSRDINKTRSFKKLILQPRNSSGLLRHFLFTYGFIIVSEILSEEGKFVCETIVAIPSVEKSRHTDIPSTDIRWQYPKTFANCNKDVLAKRLQWKFKSMDEEINNLKASKIIDTDRIKRLEEDRNYLQELQLEAKNK